MKNKKYMKYIELKKENSEKMYIFLNGVFYTVFDEDADLVNSIFGFMLKQMGNQYRKCDFPVNSFFRYRLVFERKLINYEIIDLALEKISNSDVYVTNIQKSKIIDKIEKVDLNTKTPNDALNFLYEIQNEIKNIS